MQSKHFNPKAGEVCYNYLNSNMIMKDTKMFGGIQNDQLKKPYHPPQLTVVDFRVERGFGDSPQSNLQVQNTQGEIQDYQQMMGLTEEERRQYYTGSMPSSNSGYFSGYGDAGDYFGGSGGTYF